MKKREKNLVGAMTIVGGVGLFFLVALPQWDSFSEKNNQITALREEIKNLGTQKTSLDAQVTLLERNTDILPSMTIRKYNEQTQAQIIKELLDKAVHLATGAGNRFISLAPAEVDPIIPPAPPAKTATAASVTTTSLVAGNASPPSDPQVADLPKPILSTFGYDLAVRGTYDTLQRFLKTMDVEKELMEITDITVENEASGIPGTSSSTADSHFPIRMTARIRLALQPE